VTAHHADILVIKLGALGDVVMATALVDAIVRAHAERSVEILTTPAYSALFALDARLRVHAWPRHGLRNMVEIVRWLRGRKFERIYDLQGNDRSALWCALSGARERVGNHPRFPYTHHPATPWRGQGHIFTRMCEVLAAAGVAPSAALPVLPADDARRAHVSAWLDARGLGHARLVLLHAGASALRSEKRWPHFAALAGRLAQAGYICVWLGSATERDANAALAATTGIDASGEFDVLELAELGRRAAWALTNDSGPMHVLAASGIAVFGLFGPTDWRRQHALGQEAHVIDAVRDGRGIPALETLSVDAVWARLAASGVATAAN
jgi:ADP-heptose:LPS heptosyltransferase